MKIGIGSDHAGFAYKEKIKACLQSLGHEVRDFGTHSLEPVDYPRFIRPVAEAVAAGQCERGIVLGGSGNGEAIMANRVRGVRCASVGTWKPRALAANTTTPTCFPWARAWCRWNWPCKSSKSGWTRPSPEAATPCAFKRLTTRSRSYDCGLPIADCGLP